jgi:lysophospholipase L1-like esterase
MNRLLTGLWALLLFLVPTAAPIGGAPAPIASAVPVLAAKPLRIMELGDSITAGVGKGGVTVAGGYRGTLEALLNERHYDFIFVGARTDFSAGMTQPSHEGWPGYVIRSYSSSPGAGQLSGPVTERAMRTYDPDVVLLMIGTNDLIRLARHDAGYTLPHITANLNALVGEIFRLKPSVRLIVAGVVASPKVPARVQDAFNATLPSLVQRYRERGDAISLAPDMGKTVPRNRTYFPDGIHPSGLDGYALIAADWLKAIEAIALPAGQTAAAR